MEKGDSTRQRKRGQKTTKRWKGKGTGRGPCHHTVGHSTRKNSVHPLPRDQDPTKAHDEREFLGGRLLKKGKRRKPNRYLEKWKTRIILNLILCMNVGKKE